MKYNNTIEGERKGSAKAKALNGNGRTAVIVQTEFTPGWSNYGTQFWTDEMIKAGVSENTDKTKSKFVEILEPSHKLKSPPVNSSGLFALYCIFAQFLAMPL